MIEAREFRAMVEYVIGDTYQLNGKWTRYETEPLDIILFLMLGFMFPRYECEISIAYREVISIMFIDRSGLGMNPNHLVFVGLGFRVFPGMICGSAVGMFRNTGLG